MVLLIADAGFKGYASMIATSDKKIEQQPDLVKRFIDASIEGWYSYLYGDPAPGNALIKQANPEMSDALIAYGISSMKTHGILDSGDALTHGDWRDDGRRAGRSSIRPFRNRGCIRRGWTSPRPTRLQFVNHKVGMDLKH